MVSGTFEQLLVNLHSLLDGIDVMQEAHIAPKFTFNGYPACFVAPSGNENDYLTTHENQRVYAFRVWVFAEYDETTPAEAYKTLIQATDHILNEVDAQENPDIDSRSMATNLGDGVTLLAVLATPSQFVLDTEEKMLAAEVIVRCKVTIDLTLLT